MLHRSVGAIQNTKHTTVLERMNAVDKSLFRRRDRQQSDGRNRIAAALGELLSARPSKGAGLYWRFYHDPMGVWRWERVDSEGNVSEGKRGFRSYAQCLADAVSSTFGEHARDPVTE
jgi:hypothetical protein